ncbi:uncharacterized protein [Pseudorasbora parva]|uniref:uncharacterized protein n=1 Tax=Pseudorasbora parva TaxID=51549 RepID=UPI00351DBDCB
MKMKLFIHLFSVMLFFLHHGVFGVGSDEVSVMEGDSVTLHTGVETRQQEKIKWYFDDTRIAQISGDFSDVCTDVQCNEGTERFRDRLKLDHQTGSLTITHTTTEDSGDYKLEIFSSDSNSEKIFNTVCGVSAPGRDEVNKLEGESVTLDTSVKRKLSDVITWYFYDNRIAEITGDPNKTCTDVQCNEDAERFRDRLKLDHQTGSLIITDITTEDSGEYKLQMMITSSSFSITRGKRFGVSVNDSGPSLCSIGAIVGGVVILLLAAALIAALLRGKTKTRLKPSVKESHDNSSIRHHYDTRLTALVLPFVHIGLLRGLIPAVTPSRINQCVCVHTL